MAQLLVIAAKKSCEGFKVSGFDCMEVEEEREIDAVIESIFKEQRYGLLCIEQRLFNAITPSVVKRIRRGGLPVMIPVEIPTTWGEPREGETHIESLIRRAIGYQVKLKR